MPFSAGDNVLLQATVASVDTRHNKVKLSIGFGPNRSIITVPISLIQRKPSKAMEEALTWATDLYGETHDGQRKN